MNAIPRHDTDLGPAAGLQHGDVALEQIDTSAPRQVRARRMAPFALDGYRVRRQLAGDDHALNERRWDAGNHLRNDVESSGLSARLSARYAESVGSTHGTPQDHINSLRMDAYGRQRAAMDAVPVFSRNAVWSVCIDGKPCGPSAMEALRSGLDALVRYYGLR